MYYEFNQKINSLSCVKKYHEELLETVKEYFSENIIKKNNKFNCPGKGECFTDIPGAYIFYKDKRCEKNCKLIKCPNYILCKNYVPQICLEEYYGTCYSCSVAYNPGGKGKAILKTFEEYKCKKCLHKTKCIEQPLCEHIICLDCFSLAHFKPGDNKCPVCGI